MFNVGPEKLLIILAVALIVLGPDKLPEAARTAGKFLQQARRLSAGFEAQVRSAMQPQSHDEQSAAANPPGSTPVLSTVDQHDEPSDPDHRVA